MPNYYRYSCLLNFYSGFDNLRPNIAHTKFAHVLNWTEYFLTSYLTSRSNYLIGLSQIAGFHKSDKADDLSSLVAQL